MSTGDRQPYKMANLEQRIAALEQRQDVWFTRHYWDTSFPSPQTLVTHGGALWALVGGYVILNPATTSNPDNAILEVTDNGVPWFIHEASGENGVKLAFGARLFEWSRAQGNSRPEGVHSIGYAFTIPVDISSWSWSVLWIEHPAP
jgi:hypothetical protein